jgi:hypothetical protein
VVRITTIVVKKDMIEFQLDGGGFGTFGDDTTTTVTAKPVEKSDYAPPCWFQHFPRPT